MIFEISVRTYATLRNHYERLSREKYKLPEALRNLPTFLQPIHKPISSQEFLIFCSKQANEAMIHDFQHLMNRISLFMVSATEFIGRSKHEKEKIEKSTGIISAEDFIKTLKESSSFARVSHTDPPLTQKSAKKPWDLEFPDKESRKAFMDRHNRIQLERDRRQRNRMEVSEYLSDKEKDQVNLQTLKQDDFQASDRDKQSSNPLEGMPLYESIKLSIDKKKSPGGYGYLNSGGMGNAEEEKSQEEARIDGFAEDSLINAKDISKVIVRMAQCKFWLFR